MKTNNYPVAINQIRNINQNRNTEKHSLTIEIENQADISFLYQKVDNTEVTKYFSKYVAISEETSKNINSPKSNTSIIKNNFDNIMVQKDEKELLKIVTELKNDYQPEAVIAAAHELKKRKTEIRGLDNEKLEEIISELNSIVTNKSTKQNKILGLTLIQLILVLSMFSISIYCYHSANNLSYDTSNMTGALLLSKQAEAMSDYNKLMNSHVLTIILGILLLIIFYVTNFSRKKMVSDE